MVIELGKLDARLISRMNPIDQGVLDVHKELVDINQNIWSLLVVIYTYLLLIIYN